VRSCTVFSPLREIVPGSRAALYVSALDNRQRKFRR
jgi:hypothetical protein